MTRLQEPEALKPYTLLTHCGLTELLAASCLGNQATLEARMARIRYLFFFLGGGGWVLRQTPTRKL